ncbi:MAG: hypothetical protein LBJ24_02175 [Treponema sp.]|nr:hypothetical protein [Treponema sp.]
MLVDAPNGTKGIGVGLWNDGDDEYVTRLDLNFSLTKEDYGVVVGLRNDWMGGPDGTAYPAFSTTTGAPTGDVAVATSSTFGLYNAYAWADFARDLVNVKLGIIDDGVWKTEGDEEFGVATGTGLRVEVKPIPGLNAGFFLTVPDADDYYGANTEDQQHNGFPYTHKWQYFLPETGIGGSYESDLFNVALGVKFDSNADGFAYENPVDGTGNGFNPNLEAIAQGEDASFTGGQRAYFGFSVKAVENLKAVFEGQFFNLGAYNDVGYTWLDEVIEYAVASNIKAGLVATQYFYAKPVAEDATTGSNAGDKAGVYLKFKPYGEFAINDAVAVGLELPFAFWKKVIKYQIGVEPYVTYRLADTASVGLKYKFSVSEADRDDIGPDYNQKVQLNFNYSF